MNFHLFYVENVCQQYVLRDWFLLFNGQEIPLL